MAIRTCIAALNTIRSITSRPITTGLSAIGFLGCLSSFSLPAHAEGSNDLVSNGSDRPYLEFRNDTNGGIPRKTIIKVYAKEDEIINLGSSAFGINNGTINYRDPSGAPGTCTVGLIANRAEEVAGPGDGTGGTFNACKVTVGPGQGGIWEIDFVSPNPGSDNNPPPIAGTANWAQSTNSGIVSAWDVTIKNSSGSAIPGRVYANYYAMNMGDNSRSLSSVLYVLTESGYQYSLDLNGVDPFGFILFANRNGFFNTATGDSIFRSLQFVGSNPGQLPSGYGFQNPNDPDVGVYVTHKMFINPPNPDMPMTAIRNGNSTWLYRDPEPPPVPTNFGFTGIEGTSGNAGTNPLGGTLSFDSTSQNAFSITLDISGDDIFGNANDRTFVGRSVVGSNSVFWDGLDGDGNKVAASDVFFRIRINQYSGEAHFPLIDAEQHNNGFKIRRLNTPPGLTSASEDADNIYYDDRNSGDSANDFTLCASGETGSRCYGIPPNPRQALTGIDSSGGARGFRNNFGNIRGIDTWVYYPSTDLDLPGGIVVRESDLIVIKDVDKTVADPGEAIEYTIRVQNGGPSDHAELTFEDIVPASITGVTWSCSITTSASGRSLTDRCDAITPAATASGSGNTINATLDLNFGSEATFVVNGTLSPSVTGTVTNTATVDRNLDITDPELANNSDDASTTITTAGPPAGNICYAVSNNNDNLIIIDINTGAPTVVGDTTIDNLGAIAFWPISSTLYGANGDRLGTINTSSGVYSDLSLPFGSGTGSSGSQTFDNVVGLSFDPFTGELYGVERRGGDDLLIKINPANGAHINDAFGAGVDYLVIDSTAVVGVDDIDDIAFDPETARLYGIANDGGNSGDRLVTIDITDGTVSDVGALDIGDVEGLTVFNDGTLYATTSNGSSPNTQRNRFYRVDKATGAAAEIGELTGGRNYESVACLTGPANAISGTVFLDSNTNAILDGSEPGTDNVNVRLYRDLNGNGQIDSGDPFLVDQRSPASGLFNFVVAANGAFVLDVDPATLPAENRILTTDNLETANFGISSGATDTGNDFGHFADASLAIVKRITAINGVRLTDSVDDLSDDDDNHPNWPVGTTSAGISSFLTGAIAQTINPGDEVEYTVYYLATGNAPVTNVRLCDRIPNDTTYIDESMVLFTDAETTNFTDTGADGDGAEFLPPGDSTPVPCPITDTDGEAFAKGTVSVSLATSPDELPNATGPGKPVGAYGFIRFRVNVD